MEWLVSYIIDCYRSFHIDRCGHTDTAFDSAVFQEKLCIKMAVLYMDRTGCTVDDSG